ncbi:nucleoside phosphatase family-domain-containing protein [Limtongia smithiae]|uniref:nucleoside phosphatase family-domain-containing protein n=1 Tax=Limtongia smithiae TaxID=1125753 RepID=UPI0034CDE612
MPALPSQTSYGIVIDAGSSGSRVQIYAWRAAFDAAAATLPAVGKGGNDWYKKIAPGISSYASHSNDLEHDHLEKLLKHAKSIVPREQHATTPIFLFATAGMRLLPEPVQKQLLDKTCFYIKKTTDFLVSDCTESIRVIDGETEGLYGWLALNYMLGAFDNPEKHAHGKGHHTYGFLDMGGASAQVAFAPNATEASKHLDDLYGVRLRTQAGVPLEYNVFVSTWLGYGANEARRRYIEMLVDEQTLSEVVLDPCLPNGLEDTSVFEANDRKLVGAGNLTQCLAKTYPLLSKDIPCDDDPCLFGGVHAPAIDFDVNHFIGVSEYWHTTRSGLFADLLPAAAVSQDKAVPGAYDYATFSKNIGYVCSQDWDKLKKTAEELDLKSKNLKELCFKGAWVMNMLHSGFGVPRVDDSMSSASSSNDHFQSMDTINGVELSWTLGKMILYASSQIPLATEYALRVAQNPANMTTAYAVGFGPNDGAFISENAEVGEAVADPVIVNDVDPSHGWWSGYTGFNVSSFSTQGTLSQRRLPGLVLFASIFAMMAYVLVGKVRRRKFTFSLSPKRYRRRVLEMGVGASSASGMESVLHLVPHTPSTTV